MAASAQALFIGSLVVSLLVLMWMAVPTEQSLMAKFPNVIIVQGFGSEPIEPVTFDNDTRPELREVSPRALNGLYQWDPLFYHKTFDRFVPWESRGQTEVFSCTLLCGALNSTGSDVRLVLLHWSMEAKKHLWYLLELNADDASSPIILARSKFRKALTFRSPWTTVTDGGDVMKARDLKDVYLLTAWDAFRFDTPVKWGCTAAIVAMTAFMWLQREKDD